jgi:hypothetical protein
MVITTRDLAFRSKAAAYNYLLQNLKIDEYNLKAAAIPEMAK